MGAFWNFNSHKKLRYQDFALTDGQITETSF